MGYLQTKQGLMVQQKSLLNLAACITGFQNLAKLLTKKIVDSYLKQRKQFQVENWEACPLRSSEKNEPIPFQFLDPTIPEHLKELANTELSPMRRAQLQRQYFTVRELTPEEQEKYGLQGVATATFATQNMPAGFKFALYGGHVVPKTSDENIPAEQYLHGTRIDGTDTAFHIEGYTPITETVTHIERDASGKAICESEKPELFNMHYTKSPAIIISTKERFGFPIAETTRAVKKGDLLVTTYGWNAKVVDHFINKGKVKMKVFKHW